MIPPTSRASLPRFWGDSDGVRCEKSVGDWIGVRRQFRALRQRRRLLACGRVDRDDVLGPLEGDDALEPVEQLKPVPQELASLDQQAVELQQRARILSLRFDCLLYTSDAADE